MTQDVLIRSIFDNAGTSAMDDAFNEVNRRVENALSTMTEFGADSAQVAKAMIRLQEAGDTGARGIAQTSNALRGLMDESEDADAALANLDNALDVAAAASIKAEDAGKLYGQMLRGNTAILQEFDDAAKEAASTIDGIRDPTIRAKAAQLELHRAMVRQNSIVAKLSDRFELFKIQNAGLIRVAKAAATATMAGAAAFTAVATVVGGVLVKSFNTYMEQNERLKGQWDDLGDKAENLTAQLGQMVAEAINAPGVFKAIGTAFEQLGQTLQSNKHGIKTALKETTLAIIEVSVTGLTFMESLINGILNGFAYLTDAIGKGINKAVELTRNFASTDLGKTFLPDTVLKWADSMESVGNSLEGVASSARGATKHVSTLMRAGRGLAHTLHATVDNDGKDVNLAAPKKKGKKKKGESKAEKEKRALATATAEIASDAMGRGMRGLGDTPFTPSSDGTVGGGVGASGGMGLGALASSSQGVRDALSRAFGDNTGPGPGGGSVVGEAIAEGISTITEEVSNLDTAMVSLANGGLSIATDAMAGMVEQMVAGTFSMKALGAGLLSATGDLLVNQGKALILASSAVQALNTGIANPAASIALGAAMVAFGATLRGFSARAQRAGGGGGGSNGAEAAAALDRLGRRLFEREDRAGREITINVEGRQMRGYVLDAVNEGAGRGQIPNLARR